PWPAISRSRWSPAPAPRPEIRSASCWSVACPSAPSSPCLSFPPSTCSSPRTTAGTASGPPPPRRPRSPNRNPPRNKMKMFARPFIPLALATALSVLPAPAQPAATAPAVLPGDVDLPTALRFALDHNFSILQARERIQEEEGLIIQTRAAVLPNVAVNSQYQQTDKHLQEGFGGGAPKPNDQSWSIVLQATQALFAGGKFSAAIRSEKDVREAALYELQGVINDALLDVRTKFYAVLLNQEKITVQERNLQLLEQQANEAKSRYDAGAGSQFDLLRAQVAVANGRPPLIQARNTYRISLEQLRQALGLVQGLSAGAEQPLHVVGTLDHEAAEFDLESALSSARTNRPELARFSRLQSAQQEGVKVARADYWPTLDAVGGYEVRKRTFSHDLG